MEDHTPQADNGYRHTLPVKLGTGPKWDMPDDIAVPLIQRLWDAASVAKRGQIMAEIIGGGQR